MYKTPLLAGTAALILFSYFSINTSPCPLDTYSKTIVSIKKHQLETEVANTKSARQCGLAFRNKLPIDSGMLFIFDEARLLKFWMKDTIIPLTVAYIDANKTILSIHNMSPAQTGKAFHSKQKALYALEASPEWFSDNKINIGDKVRFDIE